MAKDNLHDDPFSRVASVTIQPPLVNPPYTGGSRPTTRADSILDSLSDWVWEIDQDGTINYSNPAADNLLGYSPGDLVGRSFLELVPESDAADARNLLRNSWDSEGTPEFIRHHLFSNSRQRVLLETTGNSHYDSEHDTYFTRFVSRAVIKARMDDNSQPRMAIFAANNINEAIAVMNTDMVFTYVNEPFTRLFGYSEEEIIGQSLTLLGAGEKMGSLQAGDIRDDMQEKESWYGEVVRRHRDGQFIPCMLSARTNVDRNGNFIGFIGTYMDLRRVKSAGRQARKHLKAIISTVCNAIEDRSVIKTNHQEGVTDLAMSIALEMGKEMHFIEGLTLAAHLHDLGEMYIPPEITSRVGRLSETDQQLIKSHPGKGYEILKPLDLPWPVADIVLQHHERFDGSGYPNGLRGEQILLEARILGVADVIETMLADRPYRKACTVQQCIDELRTNRGILYDPDVVDICIRLLGEGSYQPASF